VTTSAQPLRILVVDDHPVMRLGLSVALSGEPGFVVCGEASDGRDAVSRYETLRPDVTLMDLQMPGLDGAAATEKIREVDPDACIMVLTTFSTETDVQRSIRAGARGYMLKDIGTAELVSAIRDVHAGRKRVAPSAAAQLVDCVSQVQLTMRELTVLRLLAEGKANKEIATALSIAETTVKVHLTHLFEKLGVSSRTEAMAVAARRGLVRLQ
jgi:DNA-binding NarL/FixJ family response regulator